MVSILNYTNICAFVYVKHKEIDSNITSLLVKRGELWIISTTSGTSYRKMAKTFTHPFITNLFLISWDKLKNIHHTPF